jgi:hypothetical protein
MKEKFKKGCVVCKKNTDSYLIHKETFKKYPFCDDCSNAGHYNKKIFRFISKEDYNN